MGTDFGAEICNDFGTQKCQNGTPKDRGPAAGDNTAGCVNNSISTKNDVPASAGASFPKVALSGPCEQGKQVSTRTCVPCGAMR